MKVQAYTKVKLNQTRINKKHEMKDDLSKVEIIAFAPNRSMRDR